MVLRRFGLKTGIDFAHFGLESGMVFEGTRSVRRYLSFQFQMSKKEGKKMRIRNGFLKIVFVAVLI